MSDTKLLETTSLLPVSRRSFLRGAAAAGVVAVTGFPNIVRAATKEIVVGGAASHAGWMESIVAPRFEQETGVKLLFEGTRSTVNLQKMQSNKDRPYLSVVQMDDPVMIQAVEEDLLEKLDPGKIPSMSNLRDSAIHMDGMWVNYQQPWAGVAYNTAAKPDGVASWNALWDAENKGRVIIPSLQNTEGMWTLLMAAHLETGKPLGEAQYEIDAAFKKLQELKPNLLSIYTQLTQAFNLTAQGEATLLGGSFSAFIMPQAAKDVPVNLSAPAEGVFAMPSGICKVKNCPAPDLADAYIELMLGAWQEVLAEATYSLPTNTTASRPAGMPDVAPFAPDWKFVSENRAAWIDRWDREMGV
ncbi:extracellular solute-binding protein [Telmatospirillum sp. J64-1]|uniref:extracellular solute-binding protein n=1 Tax=Telmatospirillum sp. J64-1 TaxID=2502183 RepID=UPI00115EA46A|nr:extracellular solute-binding protein [Telmatospirillum sp. J64-1]